MDGGQRHRATVMLPALDSWRGRLGILGGALGLAAAAGVVVHSLAGGLRNGELDYATQAAGAVAAAACCGLAASRAPGRLRWAWGGLAAYAGLWWVGQILWISRTRITGGDGSPLAWWADGVNLAAITFAAAAALVLQSPAAAPRGWIRSVLDGLIVGAAMTLIAWNTAVLGIVDVSHLTGLQRAVLLAYPAGNMVVLTLLVTAAVRPVRTANMSVRAPVVLLTAGFALIAAADNFFSLHRAGGDVHTGPALDVTWAAGFLVIALTALSRTTPVERRRQASRATEQSGLGFLLPAVTIAVACAITAGRFAIDRELGAIDVSSLLALVFFASLRQVFAVVDQRRLAARMAEQASRDPLTSVLNRREFTAMLRDALEESGSAVAVLFIDVDGFKAVNDTYGHTAGDALLTAVARRIVGSVRPDDVVARLGGDEFGVIVGGHDVAAAAVRTAERVRNRLRESVALGGVELKVSASIGVAVPDADETTPEALLQRADVAMYRAKAHGRDRVEVFDVALHSSLVGRLRIESEISLALERGQFLLHYQPIVDLIARHPVGVEALVRWQHPERGLLGAGEFVPVAEDTGFVVELGRWVLAEACRQAAEWRRAWPWPFYVSVNVSTLQLRDMSLFDDVVRALALNTLPARALVLEVTESSVMEDIPTARQILGELRARGVRIAIDDFGTGYSSLSKLAQPQADILKTDGLFVRAVPGSPGALISSAISVLGRTLGIELVAEGIEGEAQAHEAAQTGYRYGQGFHLGRPTTADSLVARGFLRRR